MKGNEKYLNEALTQAKEFEISLDPERLRASYMALENVVLMQEHDPQVRVKLRADTLTLWLYLLQLLDRLLDPKFNPEDVPMLGVQPPPTSQGIVYPPGADPARIDDPQARAEYEKAIAANRTQAEQYRLQTNLRRLDERITPRAEAFIRNAYSFAPSEREEVKTAILKTITNPQRQALLLKACYEMD